MLGCTTVWLLGAAAVSCGDEVPYRQAQRLSAAAIGGSNRRQPSTAAHLVIEELRRVGIRPSALVGYFAESLAAGHLGSEQSVDEKCLACRSSRLIRVDRGRRQRRRWRRR